MVDHVRHSGIYTVHGENVLMVGAGGIGAITLMTLAKMGFTDLTVFDAENVEEENIATQFHPLANLGLPKVESIAIQISEHDPDVSIDTYPENVESYTDLTSYFLISTVDSITSRKKVWDAAKNNRFVYYLDAGMAAEQFNLYTVDWRAREWYDQRINNLQEDDIPELPCTEKATFYNAMGAASIIGSTLKKLLVDEPVPRLQVFNYVSLTFWHSGIDKADNISPLL